MRHGNGSATGRRRVPPRVRVPLEPGEPAAVALRRIVGALEEVALSNVEGVLADRDAEPLHDLRVAVRRTRTLLGQMKGIFPARQVAPLVRDLRWLGAATGPCRDLDVFLAVLGAYRTAPSTRAGFQQLLDEVRERRGRAWRRVARSLATRRWAGLVRRWDALATGVRGPWGTAGPHAGRPISVVAAGRIARAHDRVVRRGRGLGEAPSPASLHRLRIDAKKLRYLLESFAPLLPGAATNRLVRRLKVLQDCLGAHHDATVQRGWLEVLGPHRFVDGAAVVGELHLWLRTRQEMALARFTGAFDGFAAEGFVGVPGGVSRG